MLNKIWFWLLLLGILYGLGKATFNSFTGRAAVTDPETSVVEPRDDNLANGNRANGNQANGNRPDHRGLQQMGKDLNGAAIGAAETSVTICISLIGIMALWLGLLRVGQDAGLVDAIARALRPLMTWLFPGVPADHPAQGAMLMNMAANMLGLDNAATPLGLKAMRDLQTLNPRPDTATNAMATFLALNTSSVTVIPFTIIAYRAAAGSDNAAGPLLGMILTTTVSTLVAVFTVRWLSRWPRFAAPPSENLANGSPSNSSAREE